MIEYKVNGDRCPIVMGKDEPLVDLLGEKFGLTGSKGGCRGGSCGGYDFGSADRIVKSAKLRR
jgi:aerobic-type carbon monoxide dehydrogenase small subunit (CoxS/CutS family)